MRQLYSLVILCLLFGYSANLSAQAPNCFDSYLSPFCSGIAQYPANSDGTGPGSGPQAPPGANYDCLGAQGNPNYFSITIGAGGSVNFTLDNSNNIDIDFILWGPFNGIAAAQNACDSMGNGGVWGNVIDCSFSGAAVEPVAIANALPGEVYILMITNYANSPTNIFSSPSTGTGSISCPCDIPYTVDTMPAAFGNQGYITDTSNNVAQFVICPNQTLGIQVEALASINDTLSLYGPFTSINSVFPNNTVFAFNPNAPSFYDSLTIFTLLTPSNNDIGVSTFNIGMKNDLYTGGLVDSSCFDILNIQVIVPGVRLTDRNTCAGEIFQILTDSIPTTTLGSSNYTWSQIAGPTVGISSTTARQPTITIPRWSSTSVADSVVLVVDYDYAGLCPMRDTMVLHFQNVNLNVTASLDSVCAGQASNLTAILSDTLTPSLCSDYTVASIPYALVAGSGTSVALGDDQVSGSLPIGFTFNFYCNNYTNFFISSNGFITFNGASGNGCCQGELLPTPGAFSPNDLIALAWSDLNPGAGGTIDYFTTGVAPNRRLVVRYNNVPRFGGASNIGGQIVLHEGTNYIDVHTTTVSPDGITTQGIENATGTVGTPSPGRNSAAWSATNSSYRFSQMNFGPFYAWTPSGSLSGNNIYNPVATPSIATTYTVTVTDGPCAYVDTTRIEIISSIAAPVVVCDSSGLTTLSFSWSDLGLPVGGFYQYSMDNGATWINVGTALSATATGLTGNTSYTILVRANDGSGSACAFSPAASTTCTTLNPDCAGVTPVNITLSPTNLLCNGDNTGCVNATITGGSGNPLLLNWSNGTMNVDSICGLAAGTYTLVVSDTFTGAGGPPSNIVLYEQAFDATHNWTLNVATGANGTENNFWQVDSDEAGMPIGACGTAGGPNRTLHITSDFNPSGGAAYNAGGLCGIFPPPLGACPETNMRAESPTFSTVGQSGITLKFNFISNGDGLIDNASVVYSSNGGASWQTLTASIKSPVCGGGQGQWSLYTATLPASCDNNPNVKVGVNWTNNDDGAPASGDPSIAIDSVVVFTTTSGASLVSCVDSMSITITEPAIFIMTPDSNHNPLCSGSADGAVFMTASGGTPSYSFMWDNNMTTEDISGLNDGSYSVTATDANGCTASAQAILNVADPIVIIITAANNNSCDGSPDGSIFLTTLGGAGGFSYLWNNNMITEDITGIPNGNYIVTVTDANGCFDTAQVTINPTVILTSLDSVANAPCNGQNGSATMTVSGGTGTYTFNWGTSSAVTTATAPLPAGMHYVTFTDSGNGCTGQDSVLITEPQPLTITLNGITNISCADTSNTGAIDINPNGGTSGYTYNWSNSAVSQDLGNLTAGTYTVTITDFNGCTVSVPFTVTQNASISVTISSVIPNLSCNLQPIGSLTANGVGGTGITYIWSNSETTANIDSLAAGTYSVVATNSDGCTATANQTINAPIVPTVDAYVSVTGMASVTIPENSAAVTISAGSTGFNYAWTGMADPAANNPNIANSTAGTTTANPANEGIYTYIVTASLTTNDTTCTATDTVWITVQAPFKGVPNGFTPNGDGSNDTFRPVTLSDDEVLNFRVYNRWGQEVYNGDAAHGLGWDGNYNGAQQPVDVYVFLLVYKRATDPEAKTIRGEVTLVR